MLHQHSRLESKPTGKGDSIWIVDSNVTDGKHSPKQKQIPRGKSKNKYQRQTGIWNTWTNKHKKKMPSRENLGRLAKLSNKRKKKISRDKHAIRKAWVASCCSLSLKEPPDVLSYCHVTTSCEIAGLQRLAMLRLVMVPLVSHRPREEKVPLFYSNGASTGMAEGCPRLTDEIK